MTVSPKQAPDKAENVTIGFHRRRADERQRPAS